MTRRVIEVCLLAYSRDVRRRDRDELRDLALELAEDHGVLREAVGLLRGGLAERWRRARPTRRAAFAVGGATSVALAVLTWPALAEPVSVEEEVYSCLADPCAQP
jgi:hypothetical protein